MVVSQHRVGAINCRRTSYSSCELFNVVAQPTSDRGLEMHKTRMFLDPLPDIQPGEYDLYHSRLRMIAMPRTSLKITYDFETLTEPVRRKASENAGRSLLIPNDFVVVPVHELQVPHIEAKFKEAIIYPPEFNVPFLAQQSVR